MKKEFVLILINTIPPYGYEINNFLALPNGFSQRVRFRRRWIAVDDPNDLVDCEGLILLRVFDTARVIPLRRIKIDRVRKVGDVFYISFRTNEIIEFSSNTDKRAKQISEFNNFMKSILGPYENVPGQNMKAGIISATDPTYLIQDEDFSGSDHDRAQNAWGNLIELLGEVEYYRGYDFLKIGDFIDSHGRPVIPEQTEAGSVYPLNSGQSYSISLIQEIPLSTVSRVIEQQDGPLHFKEIQGKWLELQAESSEIDLLSDRAALKGRYDIYRFRFRTANLLALANSAIVIALKRQDGPDIQVITEIEVPTRIRLSSTKQTLRIISLVILVISAIVVLLPEYLQIILPMIPFTSASGGMTPIQRVALVLLVISSWSIPRLERLVSRMMA